jgi:hypothetical protein
MTDTSEKAREFWIGLNPTSVYTENPNAFQRALHEEIILVVENSALTVLKAENSELKKHLELTNEGWVHEFKYPELKAGNETLQSQALGLREALENILHEGNMATQGKWDATDKMKCLAYEALSRLDPHTEGE